MISGSAGESQVLTFTGGSSADVYMASGNFPMSSLPLAEEG